MLFGPTVAKLLFDEFMHCNFFLDSYVPAALECSRNGEKSAAVSGGGFSFHDMFEHAHNLHPNGNNEQRQQQQQQQQHNH